MAEESWHRRIERDKDKISEGARLNLLKALIKNISYLSDSESELFLAPKERLQSIEAVTAYSSIERKVAQSFSASGFDYWKRDEFLSEIRESLLEIYSPEEIQSLFSQINHSGDATVLVSQFTKDHYGLRRIRNAYLPEITDFIEIDPETGIGTDRTKELFAEGPEDSVSRIGRILGIRN